MLGDLVEAAAHGFVGLVIETHLGAGQIVEQRLERLVEERQPVFLPRMTPAGAHRLIQRIVSRVPAEQLDIALPEQRRRSLAERHFGDRHQHQLLHELHRALGLRVERLDAFQRVTEEIQPHGICPPRRKEIENAAAHGVLALLHHGPGARVAGKREALRQLPHVDALAGRQRPHRLANERARRNTLQHGVDRRQNDHRLLARADGEPRQRGNAASDDIRVRPDAIVRHRIPRRKGNDLGVGREELQRRLQRIEAPVVARQMQHEARRAIGQRLAHQLRQHQCIEPLRHSG